MSPLHERWPLLRDVPRLELGKFPTPVEPLPALSKLAGAELWCKRDDLTATLYGGNKARKLEWLLGDIHARKRDTVITVGAIGSHHALATTLYARELGIETHVVMIGQPWNAHVEKNLRVGLAAGEVLHPVGSLAAITPKVAAIATRLRFQGRRPGVIVPGGSSPIGLFGYVDAGIELAEQIERGECPAPSVIYVAYGTGGTALGLAIGLAAVGRSIPIVAVRVTAKVFSNRASLAALAYRGVRRLRKHDPRFPNVTQQALQRVRIDQEQFGEGYGYPTPAGIEAVQLAQDTQGLKLEHAYTGKALAALLEAAKHGSLDGPALYYHTLNGVDLSARLQNAPEVPGEIRRLG